MSNTQLNPSKNFPSTRLTGLLANQPSNGTHGEHHHAQPPRCGHAVTRSFRRVALDTHQLRRETGQKDVRDQSADDGDPQRRQRLALTVAVSRLDRRLCGLSSSVASAGLSVSELNAEMIVEAAIVKANCL